MKNKILLICCLLAWIYAIPSASSQANLDSNLVKQIQKIYQYTLTSAQQYDWLRYLCKRIGHRLSGTPAAAAAVEYTRSVMDTLGLDSVWLQPCMVPHWERGDHEVVRITGSTRYGVKDLKAIALGNTTGTGVEGLLGEIVEVKSLKELESLPSNIIKGKIVFFNRPMNPEYLRTFHAYGNAVDQRSQGPLAASKKGAIAVLVRSMTVNFDDIPHTGAIRTESGNPSIPAFAIATNDADFLSRLLVKEHGIKIYMENTARMLKMKPSFNVIGEIRGSKQPEKIIVVGGHLDSWDVGEGAHDDGAGCVQSIEVLRVIKNLGIKPRRTIRAVMFMNEENGLAGGLAYAADSISAMNHIAGIESDAGGFLPIGFSFEDNPTTNSFSEKVSPYLKNFNIKISKGGSGADIGPLKGKAKMLFGLEPDSQRYFDLHHTAKDVFEEVNQRELNLGAAAMTSMVYLIDALFEN